MDASLERTRWDIVGLALGAGYIVGLQVGKVPPALPMLQEELDLARVTAGLVASSFYGIGAVFGVLGGLLADRLGPARLVVSGGVVMAMGSLAGGLADTGTLLLATRLVEGFGFLALTVSAPKLIDAATRPSERSLALGIWGTYMPVGMALSMMLSTLLLGAIGWRGLWMLHAGIILLFLLAFLRGTSPRRWRMPRASAATLDGASVRATLARPGPWLFGACFVLFSIQWLALMAWLPTFLIETQGRTVAGAALVSSLVVFTTAIGAVAGAWLMHLRTARWLLIGVAFVVMGGCAALIFASFTPAAARFPLAVAFALVGGVLPAACLAGAAAHAPGPGQVAMASGFVVQGAALGSVLGPPLLAAVTGVFGGWEAAWWTMLVGPGIGLGAVLALRATERRLARSASTLG